MNKHLADGFLELSEIYKLASDGQVLWLDLTIVKDREQSSCDAKESF